MLKWSPARKTSDAEPIRAVKHITLPTRPVTTQPTTSSKAPNAKRIRLKRETIRHDAPPPCRAASAEQRQRAAEPAPKVHRHQETPRKPRATLIRYDVLPARLPICHVHTSQPRSHIFSLESRKPIVPFGNHVTRGSLRLTSTSTKTVSAAQPDTTQHNTTHSNTTAKRRDSSLDPNLHHRLRGLAFPTPCHHHPHGYLCFLRPSTDVINTYPRNTIQQHRHDRREQGRKAKIAVER